MARYVLHSRIYGRIVNGHPPTCSCCGKPLAVGDCVVSKSVNGTAKQYRQRCFDRLRY